MDAANNDRGDGEKVLAMISLSLGSVLFGMLPALISERNRQRFPLTTSLLLCFGAGVLLATALVHILPEVREQMNSNFAEITLCGGFFIIYFIDELTHYLFGEAIQHTHTTNHQTNHQNYGAINTEAAPLLSVSNTTNSIDRHDHNHDHIHTNHNDAHSHTHCNDDAIIAEANARICHTNHVEPCAQTSVTGTFGLFIALSIHSTIEGLAIGVQNSGTKVLILLGAVACHKFVMAFCLGLELRSNPQSSVRAQIIGILVFALGVVGGIGIGMMIVDMPDVMTKAALPVIQGFAGGTLLYVTVCEVLPRERARWHQHMARKLAGFGQFFAVFFGFAAMSLINFFLSDED